MLSALSYCRCPDRALPPPLPEPRTAPLAPSRNAVAGSIPPHTPGQPDLPNEVWGEIASFASRASVLNLRATSHTLQAEADIVIATMTVSGNAALRALIDSKNFKHLRALRLAYVDNAGLTYFAERFAKRFSTHASTEDLPQSQCHTFSASPERAGAAGFRLELTHGSGELTGALKRVSALPLAALQLDNIFPVETSVMAALETARFAVELKGRFVHEDALIALSRIPTLQSLHTSAMQFTETVANAFASHPALQNITLGAAHGLSERSVERIAAIPHLQEFVLEENLYIAKAISYQAAVILGSQPALHTLRIHTSSALLSDESFRAISENAGIKVFASAIGPGLRHIRHMTSLQTLTLGGRCPEITCIDVDSAMSIASLPHLRSLTISTSDITHAGWSALLNGSRVETLALYDLPDLTSAVPALLAATQLRTLTIETAWGDLKIASTLSDHPTLEKLTINGMPYRLRTNGER